MDNAARVSAVVVVSALLLAPSASAKARTLRLNWVEQRTTAYYTEAMTFKVKDVVITRKAWAVHASFANRSKVTIGIARTRGSYYAGYDFGLGSASCTHQPGGFTNCGLQALKYTYAKPAFPKQLHPGQTWTGVFGGPGVPPKGVLINVIFGCFYPPGLPPIGSGLGAPNAVKEFDWITSHAFKL